MLILLPLWAVCSSPSMFSLWFPPRPHMQSEFLLLQFVITAPCLSTVPFWEEPGSDIFITLVFWVVEDSSWTPHLVFSRLNKASSLSLSSSTECCSPLTNVVAGLPPLCQSPLNRQDHVWNPMSSSGSQNAEWWGLSLHCWLHSYSTAPHPLSPVTKTMHYWLVDLLGPLPSWFAAGAVGWS